MPTFTWIGSKEKRTQQYAIFVAKLPAGAAWCGTADVVVDGGTVTIVERSPLSSAASQPQGMAAVSGLGDSDGSDGGRKIVLKAHGLSSW